MALSDFKFYAGMSPEKFAQSIGINTDGYAFLWYRAEDITPIDDGYTFEFWPEALKESASGFLLSQSTPASRYAYYSDQLNGYPAVRSAGATFMVGDAALFIEDVLNINCYMFLVCQNSTAASLNTGFGIGGSSTNLQVGFNGTNHAIRYGALTLTTAILSSTNWFIAHGSRTATGTVRNVLSNNNLDITASATNPTTSSVSWSTRLSTVNGTSVEANSTIFNVAEAIFLIGDSSFILSDSQISELNYYLSSKYAINLQSPEEMNRFYYPDSKNALRPQLNESLSSPLLYAPDGYFCRSAELPSGTTDGYATLTRHSLADGYFIGLDNTQAISLRAWVRVSGLVPNGKSQIVLFSHMDDPWKGYSTDNFIAYGLKFGTIKDDGYAALGLRLAVRDDIGDVDVLYQDIDCTGTYVADTWYRIRMDVLPIGSAEDRITVYTGTGDTDLEVWTPVGSRTVTSGQSVYRSKTQYNEQGYFVAHVEESGSNATTKYYIDRFQVRLKDL